MSKKTKPQPPKPKQETAHIRMQAVKHGPHFPEDAPFFLNGEHFETLGDLIDAAIESLKDQLHKLRLAEYADKAAAEKYQAQLKEFEAETGDE